MRAATCRARWPCSSPAASGGAGDVRPNLKPGAAANYKETFYAHVAPTLGATRLEDCKPPAAMIEHEHTLAFGVWQAR
jgi:hypothetical protein